MIELLILEDRVIAVDVVGAFGATLTAELTKFPIEGGSTRADHKIVNPATLQLEIKQTETPLDDPQYSMKDLAVPTIKARTVVTSPFLLAAGLAEEGIGAAASALGFASETPQMRVYATDTPRDRGNELWEALSELLASDELVTVSYAGASYPNMSLVEVTKSREVAGLVTFNCTFERLETVQLETVALPDPAVLALKPPEKKGKAAPAAEDAEALQGADNKSWLAAGLDRLPSL